LDFKYNTNEFELASTTYNLQLKDDGISANKLKITNTSLYSDTGNKLTVKLNENGGLEQVTNGIQIKLAEHPGLQLTELNNIGLKIRLPTTSGLVIDETAQTLGLKIDLQSDSGLTMDPNGIKIDLLDNAPLGLDGNKKLLVRYNADTFQKGLVANNYELQLKDNGIKGNKIDIVSNRPIYNNTTNNNQLDFKFNTNEFQLMSSTHPTTPYGLELKKIGASKIEIDTTTTVSLGPRSNTDDKLDVKFNNHSGLEATSTGIKLNLLGSATTNDSGLLLNTATKEGLHINLPTNSGLKIVGTGLETEKGLKIDLLENATNQNISGLLLNNATKQGLHIDLTANSGLKIDTTVGSTGLKVNLETNKPIYVKETNEIDFRYRQSEFKLSGAADLPPYALELNKVGADKTNLSDTKPSLNSDGTNKLTVRLPSISGLQILNGTLVADKGLAIELVKNAAQQNISGLQINANGLSINLSGTTSGLEIDNTGLKVKSGTFNPSITFAFEPSLTGKTTLSLSGDKDKLTFSTPTNVLSFVNLALADDALRAAASIIVYVPATNVVNFTISISWF
jgi:hypothetical protein